MPCRLPVQTMLFLARNVSSVILSSCFILSLNVLQLCGSLHSIWPRAAEHPYGYACGFTQNCTLQALVVESEGAEQLGRISRWMLKHLPTSYKPAANIGFAINTAHPVRVAEVPDNSTDSLGNAVDAARYASFWNLQSSMYDADVLKDGNKWAQCVERMECALTACSGPTQVEGEAALRTAGEGVLLTRLILAPYKYNK